MAISPKVNGAYKEMTDCKVKVAGAWKQAKKVFTKVGGVWKECWNKSTVAALANGEHLIIPVRNYSASSTKSTLKGVKIRIYEKNTGKLLAEKVVGDYEVIHSTYSPVSLTVSYAVSETFSYDCWFVTYLNAATLPNADIVCSIYPAEYSSYYYGEFEYTDCVAN